MQVKDDAYYMKLALREAAYAFEEDEVPIGAIVVCNHQVIGKGYNQVEKLTDVTAHAEMLAITAAANYLGSKFLEECTLYVTVEPCLMCATAMRWARIGRVVYGAEEPKSGFSTFGKEVFHPATEVTGGIMADACADLMRTFFREKRAMQ